MTLFDNGQIVFCLLSKEKATGRSNFASFTNRVKGMKVLLLGAGSMGQWAAQTAVTFPGISRLTIADRHPDAARALATRCGPEAGAISLDVEDAVALRTAWQAHGVVLNCVGPYYRFGPPSLRAAIGEGCHSPRKRLLTPTLF